jgi:hypothetical protein
MDEAVQSKDPAFEQKKWDDEVRLRNRELEIREREAQAAILAQERSRWTNPLVLALLGAALAGLANLAVAWKTGSDQLALAKDKNAEEKSIEETKAESARILEGVKATDPDKAAQNLTFLLDSWLITDQGRREKLSAYLTARKGGQGANIQVSNIGPPAPAPAGPPQNQEPEKPKPELHEDTSDRGPVFTFITGWIGGGHNQAEACSQGVADLMSKLPGKRFKVISSSEEVNKSLLGHVTYNYTCRIQQVS